MSLARLLRPSVSFAGRLSNLCRGPKAAAGGKKAAAGASLEPGVLLIKNSDVEPEYKTMDKYPEWLTKLVEKPPKVDQLLGFMSIQDQDFVDIDANDLKRLIRKSRKSRNHRRRATKEVYSGNDDSDYMMKGENFDGPEWKEEILEKPSSSGKKKKKGDDDEMDLFDEEGEEEDEDAPKKAAPGGDKAAAGGEKAAGGAAAGGAKAGGAAAGGAAAGGAAAGGAKKK